MTPIISPWLFYWAEVLNTLGCLLGIVGVGGCCVTGVIIWMFYAEKISVELDKTDTKIYRLCQKGFIVFSILFALSIFIPSKQILYTMYISSNITQENLNKFSDNVDTLIDKVIEKAHKYSNGGNKR